MNSFKNFPRCARPFVKRVSSLISSLISRRGDSKVSNEIKILFRFCPYQHFRIFLFLFSLLLVFSSVLISSFLLTRWKLVLFHFDSSASSFHRKSSVRAAVVSRELLSKKKNHLLVVSELVRVIVLRRKLRVPRLAGTSICYRTYRLHLKGLGCSSFQTKNVAACDNFSIH